MRKVSSLLLCETREQETTTMATHGKPAPGMECACCYDDVEGENYVEYRSDKGDLCTDFQYEKGLEKSAEIRRIRVYVRSRYDDGASYLEELRATYLITP